MGADETKTAVRGTIDIAKKQLNITETKMIYTKSSASRSDFCYIHAHLRISKLQGMTLLKGHFDGYKEDGKTICASGKLALVNAQDILNKLLEIADTDKSESPITENVGQAEKPVKIVYEKGIPESEVIKVLPGKAFEFLCKDTLLKLELWDSEDIDGDIVSVYQGKTQLIENYKLTGRNKILYIPIGAKEKDTLTMIPVSEGSEPNCTARIKLTSGNNTIYIDAITTMGKDILIILKRKDIK